MSLAGLVIFAILLLLFIIFLVFSKEYISKLFIDLLMAGREKMLLDKIRPRQESVLLERARKIMAELAPIFGVSNFTVVSIRDMDSMGIMISIFSKDCAVVINEEGMNDFDLNEFELKGAIAHELAHFKRRFSLISLFSRVYRIRLFVEETLTDKMAARYVGKESVAAGLRKIYLFKIKNGDFGNGTREVKKRLINLGVEMPPLI